MHTFSSLRNEVLRHLDEYGDTGTTKTNVDNALNQAQLQRLTETNWPFMLSRKPTTFSLVSGQQSYSLHQDFHRPLYFRNTTAKNFLIELPTRELSASGVDWNNDTTGRYFSLWGRAPVQVPLPNDGGGHVLYVQSSSTDSKSVYVVGDTAEGVRSETITMVSGGLTAGQISFTQVLSVTKGTDWAGTMTMFYLVSGVYTTMLTLFADEPSRSYQQLYTLWVPSATDSIEYRFYRTPRPMTLDTDVPEIPFPHSGILVWDALMILAAYNGEIDPGRMAVWQANQQRMADTMELTFLEGQSIESQTRTVRYIDN